MRERQKQFNKLPDDYQTLMRSVLEQILSGNTSDLDVKNFGNGEYGCRVGKYRIVYMIVDGKPVITKIGPRGDTYK